MFVSSIPKYILGIYNWGNMMDIRGIHTYHIPTKTNSLGTLFRNTYKE